jgi:hypothetical protein
MDLTEYLYFGFQIRRARRRKLEKAMGLRSAPVNPLLDIPIPTAWDELIMDSVQSPLDVSVLDIADLVDQKDREK